MRLSNLLGRGVFAVAVVAMLAMPVQARTNDERTWSAPVRERIVKIVSKLKGAIRTFGDGLSDPRP